MSENENGDCSAQMFGDYSALDPVFVDGIAGGSTSENFSVMCRWLWQDGP
jgi:hypothetical protein